MNGGVVDNAIYVNGIRTANPATLDETTDVVSTPDGPRIVGSWQGRLVWTRSWRPEGSRWVRPDTAGTPLANTATVRVSERSAVPTASGMIIAGSVLDLAGGVQQSAAVWLSSNSDKEWRVIRLPDPGARSEACRLVARNRSA